MTVVLVPIVARDGTDAVVVVGLIAGALVLVAAFARVGRYLEYMPWPVIEGFTIGIVAVGDAIGGAGNLAAAGIVTLVAAMMVSAPRVHRSLPASLLAVAAAT